MKQPVINHSLFNSQVKVDLTALNSLPQHTIKHELGTTPTANEIKSTIASMAKGTPFFFKSSFYVNDSFFVFQTRQELLQAIIDLDKHFARFRLLSHLALTTSNSKLHRRAPKCPPLGFELNQA